MHSRIRRSSAPASFATHTIPAVIGILYLIISWTTPSWAERSSGEDRVYSLNQSGQEQLKVYHFEEAQAYFKKALEEDPSHCSSFMGLLHAYLSLEDLRSVRELLPQSFSLEGCTNADKGYLEALKAEMRGNWKMALDRYEAIAKRNPSDGRVFVYMALIYLGLKEYTLGIKACQQAIKADPNFFLAHNVWGRLAQAQGNLIMAIAQFEKALEVFPDYPFGHASLGVVYLTQRMEEKAKAQFENAKRLDPDNADLLAYIGNSLLEAGKKEDAIDYYQKSLEINPENALIHYFLARIYLQEGKDEMVEKEVEATLRCAPYLEEIYRQFGYTYLEQNKLALAERYLKKQVDLNPDDFQARNALSWVYLMRGDYDLVEREAREMIKRNPQLINGYNNLGHALIEKAMFSSAIEQFQRGIAIRADVSELHAGLARAFFRKGWLEEAEAAAQEALELQPGAPDPHLTLGLVFTKKGMFDKAQAEVELLSNAERGTHLSLYLEGQIAAQKGEHEKAAEAFRKARDSFPAMSVDFLRAEALAQLKKGAIEEAVQASQRAVEINPHFALSYFDLGLAFRAMGKRKEAREALQKFLDLWRGADNDNSEVKEARTILQELESRRETALE